MKAFDKVTLNIKKKAIFMKFGYSGARKSTLVRLFNGLKITNNGVVKILGKKISKLKVKNLRKFRQREGWCKNEKKCFKAFIVNINFICNYWL
ncbi:MAG: ATP-binding cassette domain-containing protein [Streptococcaceae bacterium]|nr:ATP-binding cassette domain-containing protein [Streptococcaceae bacterium]